MALTVLFYLFSTLAIFSAGMVVLCRAPVHSVLFLILVFINAAGLFLLLEAEFLSMMLIIVYVGAVAVLFLFVVMMLDSDRAPLRQGVLAYLPIGGLVGGIVLCELLVALGALFLPSSPKNVGAQPAASNTATIGQVLYTDYFILFQIAGLVLLIAMVGAILLTLRHNERVKRQNPALQGMRGTEGLSIRTVDFRRGLDG